MLFFFFFCGWTFRQLLCLDFVYKRDTPHTSISKFGGVVSWRHPFGLMSTVHRQHLYVITRSLYFFIHNNISIKLILSLKIRNLRVSIYISFHCRQIVLNNAAVGFSWTRTKGRYKIFLECMAFQQIGSN